MHLLQNLRDIIALPAVSTEYRRTRRTVIPGMKSHDTQVFVRLRFFIATGMSFTWEWHTRSSSFYASVTGLAGETSEHPSMSHVTGDRAMAMSCEYELE